MAGSARTLSPPVASSLARWATELEPSEEDLALARRSLLDTVAVMYAGRSDPLAPLFAELSEAARWPPWPTCVDYDDLHIPSTTHISAVCVPATLASAGAGDPARAYLAGAGVMARLGSALGWKHYSAGWHATCTSGAPAAAVAASLARGLDAERIAIALALAVPAAGGVQRAFGTVAKSLQVGFATEAGVPAAALAEAGASAHVSAVEQWMTLVRGDPEALDTHGPAVPNGLAIKLYPCCYELQRPISTAAGLGKLDPERIRAITVRTPAVSLAPLIHQRPQTGLEGKFSLQYGIAAALLDGRPGIESFNDEAVKRPEAVRLGGLVEVDPGEGGDHLLAGELEIEVALQDGSGVEARLELPPGAPERPPSEDELRTKLELCAGAQADTLAALSWRSAAAFLCGAIPA